MNKYTDDSYDSYVADICKRYQTRGVSMSAANGAAEQERNEIRTTQLAPGAYSDESRIYTEKSRRGQEYMTADDFLDFYNRHRDDMGAGSGFATGRTDNVNGRASYLKNAASGSGRPDTKGAHISTGTDKTGRSNQSRPAVSAVNQSRTSGKTQKNVGHTDSGRTGRSSAVTSRSNTASAIGRNNSSTAGRAGMKNTAQSRVSAPAADTAERIRRQIQKTSNNNTAFYTRSGEVSAISAHQIKRNNTRGMNTDSANQNKSVKRPETRKRGSLLTRFFRRSEENGNGKITVTERVSNFAAEWFPPDDKSKRVKGKPTKAPIALIASIAIVTLSFMLMVSGSIMSTSVTVELGELDRQIDDLSNTEKKLREEFDMKNDMLYIRDTAVNELGMVSSDYITVNYNNMNLEDSVEFYGSEENSRSGSSSGLLSAVGSPNN